MNGNDIGAIVVVFLIVIVAWCWGADFVYRDMKKEAIISDCGYYNKTGDFKIGRKGEK